MVRRKMKGPLFVAGIVLLVIALMNGGSFSGAIINGQTQDLASFKSQQCPNYEGNTIYHCGTKSNGMNNYCIDTPTGTCENSFPGLCTPIDVCPGSGFDCPLPNANDGQYSCESSIVYRCDATYSWEQYKTCSQGCSDENIVSANSALCVEDESVPVNNGISILGVTVSPSSIKGGDTITISPTFKNLDTYSKSFSWQWEMQGIASSPSLNFNLAGGATDTSQTTYNVPSYIEAGTYDIKIDVEFGQVTKTFASKLTVTATQGTVCTETDGGKNYGEKGTLTVLNDGVITGQGTDLCNNGLQLTEYYCNGNGVGTDVKDCTADGLICSNGACVTEPYSPTYTCLDFDYGKDYTKKAFVRLQKDGVTILQFDDRCKDLNTLYEGIAGDDCADGVIPLVEIECTYGCYNGACKVPANLTSSGSTSVVGSEKQTTTATTNSCLATPDCKEKGLCEPSEDETTCTSGCLKFFQKWVPADFDGNDSGSGCNVNIGAVALAIGGLIVISFLMKRIK